MPVDHDCRKCVLGAKVRTACVWGRYVGDTAPKIMIVGEAPGYEEDRTGQPFVGPSGKKLKAALDAVGLTSYYITNIVKCFPDGTPSSTHVAACKGYLDEEIRTVSPTYILALGNSAWHYFGSGPITEHAGRESRSSNYDCWVMPTLHPAAILRDPNREAAWRLDLARFAALVRNELEEKPPVHTYVVRRKNEFAELLHHLREGPFTYDFETPVIPWWDHEWYPLTIAFSFRDYDDLIGWTVPIGYPGSGVDPQALIWFLREAAAIMADPTKPKSAHNALFDDLCWYRLTGQLPYCTADTMVMAQLLDENRLKGLKYLGRLLLGWPEWDIDAKKEHTLERLAEYNAYDAAATLLLREKFLAELQASPRLFDYFKTVEMPKIRAAERMIARGIHVDLRQAELRLETTECVRHWYQLQLPIGMNPASTKQVSAWLYGAAKRVDGIALPSTFRGMGGSADRAMAASLGLKPPKTTSKGAPSTDEETIKRLAVQHPEVRRLLDWRSMNKAATTYFEPALSRSARSFDGRLHYEYRSTSVETGRWGSPFHTIPRQNFIRSIYTAPAGRTLISADYSQIEARLAAWAAAGKPRAVPLAGSTMLAAWFTGRDVYKETAAEILKKPLSEISTADRQDVGKVVTLASLYEISPKGLREYVWKTIEQDWSLKQAEQAWAGFFRRWPEFRRWHDVMRTKVQMDGYVVSEIGRVRRLPAAIYGNHYVREGAVRAGINAPVQSLASDLTQTAMILLDQMGYAIVSNVHDYLGIEVDDDDLLLNKVEEIRFVMESAHIPLRELGLHLPHGLIRVEIKVGPWGAGEEIKP